MQWMKLPDFDAEYRKTRRSGFQQSVSRLPQASSAAATTLAKVMVDPATPPAVKVRGAECILNHALKAIEIEDVEFRIAALEAGGRAPEIGRAVRLNRTVRRIERLETQAPPATDKR